MMSKGGFGADLCEVTTAQTENPWIAETSPAHAMSSKAFNGLALVNRVGAWARDFCSSASIIRNWPQLPDGRTTSEIRPRTRHCPSCRRRVTMCLTWTAAGSIPLAL